MALENANTSEIMNKWHEVQNAKRYERIAQTQKQIEQNNAERYNNESGDLNEQDGYNCPLCHNKGFVAEVQEVGTTASDEVDYRLVMKPCKCKKIRASIMRMKRSGLEEVLKKYTFDNFETTEEWQKTIKEKAERFSKLDKGTFFIGGNSGSGKTHLCTCIARNLLMQGREVRYMLWKDESRELKAITNDNSYDDKIDQLKNIDVLYIDDFLKVPRGENSGVPTTGDLNLAYEIINYRYNSQKTTIISSEWTVADLMEFDEAMGSRVIEMTKATESMINIKRDRRKNYRLKLIKEL